MRRPAALAPLRHPAFRLLWLANLASSIGSMIQSVGAAWLMTELTSSHRLLALVQASSTIPIMLLGLFAGSAVGRDVVLEPATAFDMCGRSDVARPSLEVIYDEA